MIDTETPTAAPSTCAGCGSELTGALVACPVCGRLVHGDELRALARNAEEAAAAGDEAAALQAWRRALELLPPRSLQAEQVTARIVELSRRATGSDPASSAPPSGSRAARWLAPLGVFGLALWKFKFVLVLALSKAKLLLLGLTKSTTLFSMAASFAVYWTAWGWRFAAGLVLSLYVHEMGHVAALRRLGIKATAPMFVPGLGAFVRLKQYPADAREDARVGLAGPVWGLGAALAALALWRATGSAIWGAIAHAGAWLNLFNLLPVWQLDGSRGMHALTRGQRVLVSAALAAAWFVTREGLLLLLLAAAGFKAWAGTPGPGDRRALVELVLLVLVLSVLSVLPVPATGW